MSFIKNLLLVFIFFFLIGLGQNSYAQIDSRNQEKPDKQEATSPKKRKKVKKSKVDKRKAKGKKTYSNKKQVRKSKKSFKKGGDKGYDKSITGKKIRKPKTTPRQTYARPQPDPYKYRRIRTEKDRAGPPPKKVRTASKKGEVARTGDISGRKRIRQRSVSTNPRPVHAQPNTYRGRKLRTEKDRAYSNKKKINNVRSVSKPSESRKPKSTTRVVTATAPHRVKRKKNVYRNHEQRKGEQGSTKDIAGKKLRTKNYKSEKPSKGGRAMANPKIRSDKKKSGERFKNHSLQSGGARSVSRSSESSQGGKTIDGQRNMRNFSSTRAKSVVQPKPPRSFGNRKKGTGEAAVFAGYSARKIRTSTKKSEDKPGRRKPKAPSISGTRVFKNRAVHTYRGKDRRFSGEHSTNKDIAGRSLRTKNFKSRQPNYKSVGSVNFQSGSRHPSNKRYNRNPGESRSGRSFNNGGNPLIRKRQGAGTSVATTFKGNVFPRGMGNPNISVYRGNVKYQKPIKGGGSVTTKWNNNGSPLPQRLDDAGHGRYAGNLKSYKPLKGGGSITTKWNNRGSPLPKRLDDAGHGKYAGNLKSHKPLKGGGSITTKWNNNSSPLPKRLDDPGHGKFAGNIKYTKPKKGGGSVSKRWNNNKTPLPKKLDDPGHGKYAGNIKYTRPKKGGGSVSKHWNNNGNTLPQKLQGVGTAEATTYQGNIFPRGMGNPKIGVYQGEIKSVKGKTKPYPTQEFIGNVRIVSKKPPKSPGTEYGIARKIGGLKIGTAAGTMYSSTAKNKENINIITAKVKKNKMGPATGTKLGKKTTFSFVKIGNPNVAGLVHKQKRLKVNNNLPNSLTRDQKGRVDAASGTKRGNDWALTFWEFGSPTHMGLVKHQARAKGKLHPSTKYNNGGDNSIDEKQKVVSVKLMWAKIFKKNAGTPEPEKEFSHKLKYDKEERSIWETQEREDWYKD